MEVERMHAECVRHYVERRHTPAHSDLIVPKDEDEIRRIYACIQEEKEKKVKQIPRPIAGLTIIETVEADEETAAE